MKKWFQKLGRLVALVWKDISGSFTSPKPVLVITVAVVLIAAGQIGILIPVFPGLALTIPGLILLSLYSPTIYRVLKSKIAGHPMVESGTDKARNFLINLIKPRQ